MDNENLNQIRERFQAAHSDLFDIAANNLPAYEAEHVLDWLCTQLPECPANSQEQFNEWAVACVNDRVSQVLAFQKVYASPDNQRVVFAAIDRNLGASYREHDRDYCKVSTSEGVLITGAIEDISQKVWLIVFNKLLTFDSAKAKLTTWLYGIARFETLNYKRARQRKLNPKKRGCKAKESQGRTYYECDLPCEELVDSTEIESRR